MRRAKVYYYGYEDVPGDGPFSGRWYWRHYGGNSQIRNRALAEPTVLKQSAEAWLKRMQRRHPDCQWGIEEVQE